MQHTYILDASCFNSVETLYDEISRIFSLPDHFGRNLDALYDCLTDREEDIEVVWLQSEKSRSDFADNANQSDFFEQIISTFRDVPGLNLNLQ
jgi:RNAse (barnase) inhibitor barstar